MVFGLWWRKWGMFALKTLQNKKGQKNLGYPNFFWPFLFWSGFSSTQLFWTLSFLKSISPKSPHLLVDYSIAGGKCCTHGKKVFNCNCAVTSQKCRLWFIHTKFLMCIRAVDKESLQTIESLWDCCQWWPISIQWKNVTSGNRKNCCDWLEFFAFNWLNMDRPVNLKWA